jgi:cytochrome c2
MQKFGAPAVAALACLCATPVTLVNAVQNLPQSIERTTRSAPSDLEMGGELAGAPIGTTRYVTWTDLAKLPEQDITADDGSFTSPTKVRGIEIEDLLRSFGAPGADLVVAICSDKYQAYYSKGYIAAHHPVLVLEVDGKPPADWPKAEGHDTGPYRISHSKFTPSFKILAHRDEPQIPWGVVRLDFRTEKEVFDAIAPPGPHANDEMVRDGYKIAQQNCFRCHNMGGQGGEKSGVAWPLLAAMASSSPQFFAEYVRNPKAKNPSSRMDASPNYDDQTMSALIAYFKTFAMTDTP